MLKFYKFYSMLSKKNNLKHYQLIFIGLAQENNKINILLSYLSQQMQQVV